MPHHFVDALFHKLIVDNFTMQSYFDFFCVSLECASVQGALDELGISLEPWFDSDYPWFRRICRMHVDQKRDGVDLRVLFF